MKVRSLQRQIVLSTLAIVLISSCATTPDLSAGNPLPGIGLGASGTSVLLSWAPDGPLGRQLRPNSTIQLVASYDTDNGRVTGEPVSSTRVGAAYAGVKFDLPESLNNVATSPVCFQIVQNRRAIPVRIARPGESSAGFYYSEWVERANLGRQLVNLKQDKANIDLNVANFQSGDPQFLEWQQTQGISNAEDCGGLTVASNTSRPSDALTGAERSTAVREQCVALFDDFAKDDFWKKLKPGVTAASLARDIQSQLPASHGKRSSADQLVADINRFGAGRSYFNVAELPFSSASFDNVLATRGNVNEFVAVSLVEAYEGCLFETERRFENAYQAWQKNRDPSVRQELTEARRSECRARFSNYNYREERLQTWLGKQAEVDGKIAKLQSEQFDSLPVEKSLIPEACPFR